MLPECKHKKKGKCELGYNWRCWTDATVCGMYESDGDADNT